MYKFMLICSIALISACSSVGTAANAAKNEKKAMVLIVEADHPSAFEAVLVQKLALKSLLNELDLVFIVEDLKTSQNADLLESLILMKPPLLFDAPEILRLDIVRNEADTPYIMPALKNKFHPKHLFNPLKVC